MSKNNKLLILTLSFVVVCVVGFALFSETITVTGTATAYGNFDMIVTCEKGISSKISSIAPAAFADTDIDLYTDNGYENDYCNVSGNSVTYGASLKYPGAARYFTIKIKNNGTMDAVITNESHDYTFCVDADNSGEIASDECHKKGSLQSSIINQILPPAVLVSYETPSGVIVSPFDSNVSQETLNLAIIENGNNIALKPGASMYIVGISYLHATTGSPQGGNVYFSGDRTVTFTFTQPTN